MLRKYNVANFSTVITPLQDINLQLQLRCGTEATRIVDHSILAQPPNFG